MVEKVEYLIVGAGVSGLAVGKILDCLHKEFLIVEKSRKIGGVWDTTNYDGLGSHTPSYIYRYWSKPWKNQEFCHYYNPLDLCPDQPSKHDILNYLKSYSKPFESHIIFNSKVKKVVYDTEDEKFTVSTVNAVGKETESTFVCKYLIVTIGNKLNAGHKRLPNIIRDKESSCEIVHSSHFCNFENYKNKRIVVVGTGKSSQDILITLYKKNITDVKVLYERALWSMYYDKLSEIETSIKLKIAFLLKAVLGWNRFTIGFLSYLLRDFMVNIFDKSVDPDNWNLGVVKRQHVAILRAFRSEKIPKIDSHRIANNHLIVGDQFFKADVVVYATGFKELTNENLFDIYKKTGNSVRKFKIEKLYNATMCVDMKNLFIPCGRGGFPAPVQSELDAMWIVSYILGGISDSKLNESFITPFPYNVDPRSMTEKFTQYKKLKNKFITDIKRAGVFEVFPSANEPCYNCLLEHRNHNLFKVIN